ncbi:hypothetical protein AAC691_07290 [Nguyenibacter vanlangensis]|uniref:Uncharacterized protein n=1 Tax=Nguyenibacter vanlangensis TaxID=1216886 RepID=A0ABZ3D8V2_9PROT
MTVAHPAEIDSIIRPATEQMLCGDQLTLTYLTATQLVHQTGLSAPTVNAALADLERFDIVEEVTGRKRGRVFSYRRYLAILSEGTDPLPTEVAPENRTG